MHVKPETIKYIEQNIGTKLMKIGLRCFYDLDSKGKGNKRKNIWMELHQTTMLLHNKAATKQMDEYIGKWYFQYGANVKNI